jgi:spermidine/putrescine transport system permease protein
MTAAAEGSAAHRFGRASPGPLLQSEAARGFALVSPTFLYALVLLVVPILVVIAHSFWTQNYLTIDRTFTLEQYRIALTEPIYRDLLLRSLFISFTVSVFTVVLAYPIAYYISFHGGRHKNLWLFLITIPFWTNLLIRTFAVLQIIRNEGIINTALQKLGIIDAPLQILYSDVAIMLGMVYVYLPLMVLPVYASMEKLDFRLIEAAYDLYATRFKVLWRIILPLVKPGVIAGSILVFIPAIGAYVTPSVLGGGKNMMLANLIELQFGQGRNWPLGASLSIAVMMIVMVALLVYVRNAGTSEMRHG